MADIPLLFETGHEHEFDRVVVVACAPARQIERLRTRNAMSEEEAQRRLDAQWPIARKVDRANYVIATDATFEETDTQTDRVHRALLGEADRLMTDD
jgi:dephospho-CoA kinase